MVVVKLVRAGRANQNHFANDWAAGNGRRSHSRTAPAFEEGCDVPAQIGLLRGSHGRGRECSRSNVQHSTSNVRVRLACQPDIPFARIANRSKLTTTRFSRRKSVTFFARSF